MKGVVVLQDCKRVNELLSDKVRLLERIIQLKDMFEASNDEEYILRQEPLWDEIDDINHALEAM